MRPDTTTSIKAVSWFLQYQLWYVRNSYSGLSEHVRWPHILSFPDAPSCPVQSELTLAVASISKVFFVKHFRARQLEQCLLQRVRRCVLAQGRNHGEMDFNIRPHSEAQLSHSSKYDVATSSGNGSSQPGPPAGRRSGPPAGPLPLSMKLIDLGG